MGGNHERRKDHLRPTYFSGLQDPRIERNKLYPLKEVIVITILATTMAQGWEDIERYALAKEAWPRQFLPLENVIPPHDVYRRVMIRIRPKEVETCFMNWVGAIKSVFVDGKLGLKVRGKPTRGCERIL